MKIKTDKGKTFDARWAVELKEPGEFSLEITDDRSLADIADDFDGVKRFERESDEGVQMFEGYEVLTSIVRNDVRGTVLMTMKKP